MRVLLIVVGLILFISVSVLSLNLLSNKLISGGEFSAIFIAFAVISLLIPLLPEVQNFSIAGNSVTFKEVKKEAQNAILELQNAQLDTIRLLLVAITNGGGLKPLDSVLSDNKNFWELYGKILQNGYKSQLSGDILTTVEELLKSYIFLFVHSSDRAKEMFSLKSALLPKPSKIIDSLLGDNNLKHRELVTEGMTDYQKLYDLHSELSK